MARELERALGVLPDVPARRIRLALAFHDFNQHDLADAIGADYTLVSRKLNGRRDWSEAERDRVARFLGVPERLLFPEAA